MIRVMLLILAALALPVLALAQSSDAPMVRPQGLVKVGAHVWMIPDESVGGVSNIGFIVGSRAALVIDTGLGPKNGEIVLAVARKLAGKRKLYLATTHVHPEHDLGAQAFPADTVMIRSEDEVRDIDEFGLSVARVFAQRSPAQAELLKGAEFRKADITFAAEHRLDLGGVSVRLMAMGPNHTRGDTAFWVEPDRVLFAGDVVTSRLPGLSSPYSSVGRWMASLDRLEALKPALIVPSHGPNGGSEMIGAYRAFFTAVRGDAAVQKAKGLGEDAAAQAVAADLKDRWPAERVAPVAKVAFREAN